MMSYKKRNILSGIFLLLSLQLSSQVNLIKTTQVPNQFTNCQDTPAKKIKKGWQTLEVNISASEGMKYIVIGNTKPIKEMMLIYVDNVKFIARQSEAEGTMKFD